MPVTAASRSLFTDELITTENFEELPSICIDVHAQSVSMQIEHALVMLEEPH